MSQISHGTYSQFFKKSMFIKNSNLTGHLYFHLLNPTVHGWEVGKLTMLPPQPLSAPRVRNRKKRLSLCLTSAQLHQCTSSPNFRAEFYLVLSKNSLNRPPHTGAGAEGFPQWHCFQAQTCWVTVLSEKLLSYFPPTYKSLPFCPTRVCKMPYTLGTKEKEGLVHGIHTVGFDNVSDLTHPRPHLKLPTSSPVRPPSFRLKLFHIQAIY